jgi:CHAT domain-containing protein
LRGLSFSQADSTLRGGSWKYLKFSEKETANIAAIIGKAGIPATTFGGYEATEEAFKKIGKDRDSPRILHLSTHGYFFPDSKSGGDGASDPVFKTSEHPMIRSGLILAGGNHAWQTGKPLGRREDGVLTAYEISQMNLAATELVVLSACETGLGDIRGNEGVYGLQRAFKIAGAKNLLMSLWQVPDFQTQELMTLFYQKWLLEKMPVRKALHTAQEEMRAKGYEPFYWAGFVLVE